VSGPAPGRERGILVVDDSGYARLRARRFLESRGVENVLEAADGEEALAVYFAAWPSLVVLDQVMRGTEGLEVARTLREADPQVRVVMLTVLSDPDLRDRARDAGVLAVVAKDRLEDLAPFLGEESDG